MGLIQNKVTVSQPNSHVVVKNAGGLRGLTGETGPQGPQGVPGEAATVTAGTTTTLPAGSDATVQNVGSTSAAIFNFGIPKGDKGDTGETGAAATISVGSTSTLPAGSSATVTNSGTSSAAVFDFGIPKGDKGDTGATGADGYSPSATVTKTGDTATITITDKDGTTTAQISDGVTPTVNDGTLTIQKNGTTVQTFSADQASNVTANITVPTQFSELSGTVSSSQIEDEAITTGSVSGTGTNITLAGTMEGGAIESVELNGDTEQTTYSGKNLLNQPSSWSFSRITNFQPLTAGTYYVSCGSVTKGGENDPCIGSSNSYVTITSNMLNKVLNFAGTDLTVYSNGWSWGASSVTSTVENLIITTSPISSIADYEPYVGGTASPNPDYPQEVQTVTGEQSIEVHTKNLFNVSLYDGITQNADGTVKSTKYYTATTAVSLHLEPSTRYTISIRNSNGELNGQGWGIAVNGTWINTTSGTGAVTTDANGDVTLTVGASSYGAIGGYNAFFQLEKGNQATAYEPYKGVTKTVNLGKNLCNPSDIESVFVYASFNRAAYGAGDTSVIIPVLPNTDYTISTLVTQARYRGGFSDSIPVSGGGDITVYNGFNKDSQLVSVTTNSGDHKYLIVNATDLSKIQIEKGSTATTYAPYFTPIELCKIGTYQDYIYKSGEDWYIHKETKHITVDGTVAWWYASDSFTSQTEYTDLALEQYVQTAPITVMSDQFTGMNWWNVNAGTINNSISSHDSVKRLKIYSTTITSAANMQSQLSANPMSVYYGLSTPTDTQITNATLISELEDLLSATTYSGTTYITVSGDLSSPLEVVAEADSKLAPDSVYGAAIKDGAVSTDKIEDGAVTPAKISTSAYQSGETAVGTWIDGKTIYRQVLTGTAQITANNVATVTTTIAAKSIVSTSGWYQSWKQNDTTSNKVAFGQLMGNNIYSYALIRSGNYIELGFISSVNVNSQYEVVVEYTKKD